MIARTMVKAAALAAALAPLGVAAQQAGNFELSGFGRYTYIHKDRPVENGAGLGAGIGVYLSNRFRLTADGSFTPTTSERTGADLLYTPLHLRLLYELPLGSAVRAYLGTGYVYNRYGSEGKDNGLANLVGVKAKLSEQWSLFTQLGQEWLPPYMNHNIYILSARPTRSFTLHHRPETHYAVEAGLSARLGGRTPAMVAITEPVRQTPAQVQPAQQQTPPPTPPPTQRAQQQVQEKAAEPAPAPERYVTLEPVFFDFDRWNLLPQAREYLVRVAAILRANPETGVLIEGHTDQRGTDPYNAALALKRANAVRDFLVAQNVDARRLETASRGKSQPADAATTEQAYARNRRVEFRLPMDARLREPR